MTKQPTQWHVFWTH